MKEEMRFLFKKCDNIQKEIFLLKKRFNNNYFLIFC